MSNEITDTYDNNPECDEYGEPCEPETHMVATVEPENKGIEFHVSMRGYTLSDMDNLIIEAAARQLLGRRSDTQLAKAIEEKCIQLTDKRILDRLSTITAEIINQPLIPEVYGKKEPVTMGDFIGLTAREYLSKPVEYNGEDSNPKDYTYNKRPTRMQWLVEKFMNAAFKKEIEATTNVAIKEIQSQLAAEHKAIIDAEKQRFADALAKLTSIQ